MKKKLSIILSTAVVAASVVVANSVNAAEVQLVVNGENVVSDQAPVIESGRTLVPFRAIGEALGAEIDWEANSKTVTFENDTTKVQFQINGDNLTATDKETNTSSVVAVDVPATIINGRTMVPVRVVSENLGFDVDWDADTKTVYVGGVTETTTVVVEESTEVTTESASEETSVEESTEETTVDATEETSVEVTEETTAEEDTEETTEASDTEETTEEADAETTTEAE